MNKPLPGEIEHIDPVEQTVEVAESSFLNRWSARKLQARQDLEQATFTPTPHPEPAKPNPAPRELTDADMPPLETLDDKSDYSAFFSSQVSATLRRQALRKLFHSPAFNVTDDLDVYVEDFTKFAGLGDIVTQDMRHMMEVMKKRLAQQTEPSAEAQAEEDSVLEDSALTADSGTTTTTATAENSEWQTERKETTPQDDEPHQA